jgi:hypothetical protein
MAQYGGLMTSTVGAIGGSITMVNTPLSATITGIGTISTAAVAGGLLNFAGAGGHVAATGAPSVNGAPYVPHGNEFRVNSQTAGSQEEPNIAVLTTGAFVVVWEDRSEALRNANIKAQIYDISGVPVGGEFLVNTQTSGNQFAPTVTSLSGGRFVVTWSDNSGLGDGSSNSVQAQIFNGTGGRIGTEFVVNTQTTSSQALSDIIRLTNGGFVVTWSDAVGNSIKAQVYDANGVRVGSEFTVKTQASGFQESPKVAALANGGFVVTWEDDSGTLGDNSEDSITAQLFDPAGAKIGGEFRVNTTTLGPQKTPDIATLTDGRFVISWYDGSTGDIKAQLFDPTGARVGAEFLVNTEITHSQTDPSIAAQADGSFIITWTDYSPGISDSSIKAQAFDAAAARVGTEFQVNTNTAITQVQSSAAGLPDGGLVVVWRDHSQTLGDTDSGSIKAQMYARQMTGNDTFFAPDGNQRFDAGGGIDTITFRFALADASISYVGNTIVVDSASSHTVLTGFEKFAFADGTVNNADGDVLVDDLFYYSKYRDVWNAHVDADVHYHAVGWHEGRDPSAFFSTSFYRALNPDVKAAGIDPLVHFHQSGWQEGRIPSLTFDARKYLAVNPDVAAAHLDPLWHFLAVGAGEGRQPIAPTKLVTANGFDAVYYMLSNPDVAAAGIDPFWHFQNIGWKEGRDPNALFDASGYLATYGDVAAAHINPFDHYNAAGWKEGRDPSVDFDTTSYLAAFPDVAAANVNPLMHFLAVGQQEGRSPFADGVWG